MNKPLTLAILSDIHANLAALEAVLAHIDASGADHALCLGDVIGYGPDPEACARLLMERNMDTVMGNHDQVLLGYQFLSWFNPQARDMLLKTRSMLTDETIGWLTSRPHSMVRHGARFVHGCPPDSVRTYIYKRDVDLDAVFGSYDEQWCFVGHTHELGLYVQRDGAIFREPLHDEFILDQGQRVIVNAGAVGQPRDGDPRAKYLLWEPGTGQVRVQRVKYDIARTVARLRERGFPAVYGKRLG